MNKYAIKIRNFMFGLLFLPFALIYWIFNEENIYDSVCDFPSTLIDILFGEAL